MIRRSEARGVRGAGALCFVLLQLVSGAALPFADAMLEAEVFGFPTHVESPHHEDCPAAHDHLFCQVVRSLSSASTTGGVGSLHDLPLPVAAHDVLAYRSHADHRPSLRGPTTPRPPPLG